MPTVTSTSISLHPTGHANDWVFFLRETRNHGRVLSRGHDKIRSLTSPGQAMNTAGGTEARYAGEPQGCWLHGVITCYAGLSEPDGEIT